MGTLYFPPVVTVFFLSSSIIFLAYSQRFYIRPRNIVNVGPLTAELGWRVWGTPANFNGFRVLASLLHRRRSTEVNQTLHKVWPSPAMAHYV